MALGGTLLMEVYLSIMGTRIVLDAFSIEQLNVINHTIPTSNGPSHLSVTSTYYHNLSQSFSIMTMHLEKGHINTSF